MSSMQRMCRYGKGPLLAKRLVDATMFGRQIYYTVARPNTGYSSQRMARRDLLSGNTPVTMRSGNEAISQSFRQEWTRLYTAHERRCTHTPGSASCAGLGRCTHGARVQRMELFVGCLLPIWAAIDAQLSKAKGRSRELQVVRVQVGATSASLPECFISSTISIILAFIFRRCGEIVLLLPFD
eukprot:SAG31_NODE_978_length_10615_cov_4.488208_2_plen_183_part_00